jgi:hypothetical protein
MPIDITELFTGEMTGENSMKRGVYDSMAGKFKVQEVNEKIETLNNLNKKAEGFLTGDKLEAFKEKAASKFCSLLDEI